MINLLRKPEELIGKTIKQVLKTKDDTYIKFEDGTFAIFEVGENYLGTGFSQTTTHHVMLADGYYPLDRALVALGYYTDEEYVQLLNEDARKRKESEELTKQLFREQEEAREKALLKTLQEKYK